MSFKDSLKTKDFVVTAQVNLAQALEADTLLHQAETLAPAVDAVQLSDSNQIHMSGLAAAALLLQRGIDPIIHMNCRDRNRVTVVAVFDFGKFGDDMGLCYKKAESHSSQSIRFAQCASDHHTFVLPDQFETVLLRKVGVGFIDDQWTSQRSGDLGNFCGANEGAAGAVGIG